MTDHSTANSFVHKAARTANLPGHPATNKGAVSAFRDTFTGLLYIARRALTPAGTSVTLTFRDLSTAHALFSDPATEMWLATSPAPADPRLWERVNIFSRTAQYTADAILEMAPPQEEPPPTSEPRYDFLTTTRTGPGPEPGPTMTVHHHGKMTPAEFAAIFPGLAFQDAICLHGTSDLGLPHTYYPSDVLQDHDRPHRASHQLHMAQALLGIEGKTILSQKELTPLCLRQNQMTPKAIHHLLLAADQGRHPGSQDLQSLARSAHQDGLTSADYISTE